MSNRIKSAIFSRSVADDLRQQIQQQKLDAILQEQNAPNVLKDPTFGVSIGALLKRDDHQFINPSIPNIVRHCVQSLYNSTFKHGTGLYTDGIFRESGNNMRVKLIKELYDTKEINAYMQGNQRENPFDICDPHTTASVLRLYLRELPDPIMGYGSYDPVLAALRNHSVMPHMTLKIIKECIRNDLDRNQKTLVCVLLFLLKECARLNDKMKASNLGIVFGQVFFREPPTELTNKSSDGSGNAMLDMQNKMKEAQLFNTAVEIMISNYQDLFTGDEPALHKVYDPFLSQNSPLLITNLEQGEEEETLNELHGIELVFKEDEEEEISLDDIGISRSEKVTTPVVNVSDSISRLLMAHKKNLVEEPAQSSVPETQTDEFYPSETQINKTINELDQIIKDCQDEETKKRLEDVYARIYHSVYAVVSEKEDVVPYAVLLDRRRAEYERKSKLLEAKEKKLKNTLTKMISEL